MKSLSFMDLFKGICNTMLITSDPMSNMEVPVYFDFPMHGVNKKYKIVSIGPNGIMLYNDEVTRPIGH